jgi:hypothetical protein
MSCKSNEAPKSHRKHVVEEEVGYRLKPLAWISPLRVSGDEFQRGAEIIGETEP